MTEAEHIEQLVIRASWDAWFETYGVIQDVSGKWCGAGHSTPLVANYLQQQIAEAVRWLEDNNLPVRLLILKPRQRGCSTFSTAGLYHSLMSRPQRAAIIGAKEDQAMNLFKIFKTYAGNDRFDWGGKATLRAEDAFIEHGDGQQSHVGLLSAKEYDPGRSGTYQFVLGTEVARWSERGVANAADVLSGLLKCVQLIPGTTVIQETTASGASGDFYDRWTKDALDLEEYKRRFREGKSVQGTYVRVFAPWFMFPDLSMELNPTQQDELRLSLGSIGRYNSPDFGTEQEVMSRFGLTLQQVAWRRYAIDTECKRDSQVFEQDYPSTWETAFLSSGRKRFNIWGLKHFENRVKQVTPKQSTLEWQGTEMRDVVLRPVSEYEATLSVWESPRMGNKYLISIDPATGSSQTTGADPDFHSVLLLRAGKYQAPGGWHPPMVAARLVPNRWDIDVLADYVHRLSVWASRCIVVPEVNMDRGLIELLKQRGVAMYRREVFNQLTSKHTEQLGWHTNVVTREACIENLAKAIREYDSEGEGVDICCPHIVDQLKTFIQSDKGKSEAAEGSHDDDVLSLAIGLHTIDCATAYKEEFTVRPLPRDLRKLEEGNRRRNGGKSQYS